MTAAASAKGAAEAAGGEAADFFEPVVAGVEKGFEVGEALAGFLKTDDGANLLAGFNRAASIIAAETKKGGAAIVGQPVQVPGAPAEETALLEAWKAIEPRVDAALSTDDYTAAMSALAGLRAPVDGFFDKVFVNDPDPALRDNRLLLLTAVRDTMQRVADFSLING